MVLNFCDYHMHIYGVHCTVDYMDSKKGKTSFLWPGWMEWINGKELFGPLHSSAHTWCQKHQVVEDCKAAAGQWSSCWGGVSGMSWAGEDAVSTQALCCIIIVSSLLWGGQYLTGANTTTQKGTLPKIMVGEYNKVGSVFIGGYFRHRMVTFQQGKEYSTFTATSTSATTITH